MTNALLRCTFLFLLVLLPLGRALADPPVGADADQPAASAPASTQAADVTHQAEREDPAAVAAQAMDSHPPWPWWLRYPLWAFLGLIGGLGVGKLLVRQWNGLGILVPIGGGAVWSIVHSLQLGHSVIPPIVCIVLMVLLSGVAAQAARVAASAREGES